jgi:hypothetical protein
MYSYMYMSIDTQDTYVHKYLYIMQNYFHSSRVQARVYNIYLMCVHIRVNIHPYITCIQYYWHWHWLEVCSTSLTPNIPTTTESIVHPLSCHGPLKIPDCNARARSILTEISSYLSVITVHTPRSLLHAALQPDTNQICGEMVSPLACMRALLRPMTLRCRLTEQQK